MDAFLLAGSTYVFTEERYIRCMQRTVYGIFLFIFIICGVQFETKRLITYFGLSS